MGRNINQQQQLVPGIRAMTGSRSRKPLVLFLVKGEGTVILVWLVTEQRAPGGSVVGRMLSNVCLLLANPINTK